MTRFLSAAVLVLWLGGCAATSERSGVGSSVESATAATSQQSATEDKKTAAVTKPDSAGRYYLDDGPPGGKLEWDKIEWVSVREETISPARNRPYTALGNRYTPYTALPAYKKRGMASWYGRRYHGRQTASGETYNMYKMTAAHPILPIPSYARVTHIGSGKNVTVRVNDRGPFLGGRIIDLSYAAAAVLGYVKDGTAEVIVETIVPPRTVAKPVPAPVPADDSDARIEKQAATGSTAGTGGNNGSGAGGFGNGNGGVAGSGGTGNNDGFGSVGSSSVIGGAGNNGGSGSGGVGSVGGISGVGSVGNGNVYIQLGAFSKRTGAETMLKQARQTLPPVYHPKLVINFMANGLYGVHIGPYISRPAAAADDATFCGAHGWCGYLTTHPQ